MELQLRSRSPQTAGRRRLDEVLLASAGRWVFTPATLNGEPVAVRVRLDMSFAVR